jgi:hypothetical protein
MFKSYWYVGGIVFFLWDSAIANNNSAQCSRMPNRIHFFKDKIKPSKELSRDNRQWDDKLEPDCKTTESLQ